jgi:hypothetical protein
MKETQLQILTRGVIALEQIAEQTRKIASPTQEEIQASLQQRLDTAIFLDAQRPESQPPH